MDAAYKIVLYTMAGSLVLLPMLLLEIPATELRAYQHLFWFFGIFSALYFWLMMLVQMPSSATSPYQRERCWEYQQIVFPAAILFGKRKSSLAAPANGSVYERTIKPPDHRTKATPGITG